MEFLPNGPIFADDTRRRQWATEACSGPEALAVRDALFCVSQTTRLDRTHRELTQEICWLCTPIEEAITALEETGGLHVVPRRKCHHQCLRADGAGRLLETFLDAERGLIAKPSYSLQPILAEWCKKHLTKVPEIKPSPAPSRITAILVFGTVRDKREFVAFVTGKRLPGPKPKVSAYELRQREKRKAKSLEQKALHDCIQTLNEPRRGSPLQSLKQRSSALASVNRDAAFEGARLTQTSTNALQALATGSGAQLSFNS